MGVGVGWFTMGGVGVCYGVGCCFFPNFGSIFFAKIVSPTVRKSKSETLDIQTHAYLTHQSPRNV